MTLLLEFLGSVLTPTLKNGWARYGPDTIFRTSMKLSLSHGPVMFQPPICRRTTGSEVRTGRADCGVSPQHQGGKTAATVTGRVKGHLQNDRRPSSSRERKTTDLHGGQVGRNFSNAVTMETVWMGGYQWWAPLTKRLAVLRAKNKYLIC